jgi:hypothetical protein
MNKTKLIRIKLTTWRELRRLVPGKRGETAADYMDRVKEDLELK